MADNETRSDAKEENNVPGTRDADDIKLPPAATGASLPAAMVHRDSHSPQVKAD